LPGRLLLPGWIPVTPALSPLLTDNYYSQSLLDKFNLFPSAKGVLLSEANKNLFGQINIERLMTRLEGGDAI